MLVGVAVQRAGTNKKEPDQAGGAKARNRILIEDNIPTVHQMTLLVRRAAAGLVLVSLASLDALRLPSTYAVRQAGMSRRELGVLGLVGLPWAAGAYDSVPTQAPDFAAMEKKRLEREACADAPPWVHSHPGAVWLRRARGAVHVGLRTHWSIQKQSFRLLSRARACQADCQEPEAYRASHEGISGRGRREDVLGRRRQPLRL